MKAAYCVLLLTLSNIFMTLAWYGHLQLKQYPTIARLSFELAWNHVVGFGFTVVAVFFIFKKW